LWQDRWRSGDSEGAGALAAEALRLVTGRDDWVEAWTLHAWARHLALSGRHSDEVRALLPRAMAVATRAGHVEALSGIHNTRGVIAKGEAETVEAFDDAVRFAIQAGVPDTLVTAVTNGGFTALWLGNMERALEWTRRGLEAAERTMPGSVAYCRAGAAWAQSLYGHFDAAAENAAPVLQAGDIPAKMVALTALTEVHLRRGDVELAREFAEENWRLAEANGEGQRVDPALSDLARVRLLDGPGAADDIVERILEGTWAPGTHAFVTPDLARALAEQGAADRLRGFLAVVGELTERDPSRHNHAALELCRGSLSALREDHAAALDAYRAAHALYAAMPCPARDAEALLGLARTQQSAGHRTAAAAAASSAREIAVRLQSPPLLRAADELLRRGQGESVLTTVLVTDIVASTERAARVGDRAWRDLLERHHAIVRHQLDRHRGHEVDTAGDGFLARFDSPARAIHCAQAIVQALASVGIGVRTGIHTGECEVVGDRLAGIAVHTAARIAATAGAGEVVVSSTVRDLVAGSGIAFDDRGSHPLRGVPGEWRLFAVTAPAA
jgi:class 3 adenylate cyclase